MDQFARIIIGYHGCTEKFAQELLMNIIPSTQELAREALEVLNSDTRTPEEHFESLVQEGIIDREGRVICAKLFGATADRETPTDSDIKSL